MLFVHAQLEKIMLQGISKPEIPGKEFNLFASEGMLQDTN